MWESVNKSLDVHKVKQSLSTLNISFPNRFYEWLSEFHGAVVEDEIEIITKDGEEQYFYKVFTLDQMIDKYKEALEDDEGFEFIFPFAWDVGKNHFCFDYRGGDPTIIFLDTDYFISHNPEAAEPICDSFDEFLDEYLK
ncbi:SMI1/KNR4 family protein [Mechercharimyces sp. CAU 1602]|uniref:SMI1/KNR4 family protein n=1 Tax=Mechercharimyces sp. CAU 1602 TaxID=2973933 RepID=UPI0021639D68|nr:SMI1/KNR4 family protein [Mechercharimyces sp. CAU 1602]MCS1351165.1 SMI1/KNR4 family protein [Mechercharimyces sp. CAU 1602]